MDINGREILMMLAALLLAVALIEFARGLYEFWKLFHNRRKK